MNFYGIRELSNNTKSVLNSVDKNGSAIITDNGKPTALMLNIDEANFERVIAMVYQIQALNAFNELQNHATAQFPNGLSDNEIQKEIEAVRRGE